MRQRCGCRKRKRRNRREHIVVALHMCVSIAFLLTPIDARLTQSSLRQITGQGDGMSGSKIPGGYDKSGLHVLQLKTPVR